MYLFACNAEDCGELAVETGLCREFKIVIKIGNAAACLSEKLAARADSLAVSVLAVFFYRLLP